MVLMTASVVVSNIVIGLLLANQWPDLTEMATPWELMSLISPAGASVSRSHTVSLPGLPDRATYWHAHAARMKEEILEKSWCEERQAFAESFGGHELDASILLMAEVGLIDARDPRFISTVEAMEKSLCDGPYMRRYEAADDFGKPETAFNICTFWRIDALAKIGRKAEARQIFETMLAARNPLGLLSEDTHPVTGEMLGNFPQTYSMVGIINAAVRLSAPWDSCI